MNDPDNSILYSQIKMIELSGPWILGYALDIHTLKSEYTGEDQYGRPVFNTLRSKIGQCIYNLKYVQQFSEIEKIMDILLSVNEFKNYMEKMDIILPAIPTNKNRQLQPVILIAQEIARVFSKEMRQDIFISSNYEEIKNFDAKEKYKRIRDNLSIECRLEKNKNILLFDDVFDSGSTLTAMTNIMLENGYKNIFVFTLTKTRITN